MILSTHGIVGSQIAQFDVSYQAILNYATTQGYTLPSAGQRVLQNQLVIDLKAGGIWTKLDTFSVFATDGNSDFALIDWIRLSQYTAVNSPTFTTNGGFKGNGTSSYINTEFSANIGVNYTLNNASRFFWVDDRLGTVFEGIDTTSGNNSFNNSSSNHIINSGNTAFTGGNVDFAIDGWHSICRDSSSTISLFTNTTRYDRTSNSISLVNNKQVIDKRASTFAQHRFRCWGAGASLISENTDLYNALNTYLTSL